MSEEKDNDGIDERLVSFIERIERLEEEKKGVAEDIKMVFDEAKAANYDSKTIKQIIKLRKMDASEREESDFLLDEYKRLTGMQI
jgi:uncharacterized protein (UPF0335 family)